MLKNQLKATIFFFVSVSIFVNTGCEKFRNNREVVTASNHALAESSFDDIFRAISWQTSPGGGLVIDSCYNVSWTADSIYPRTLTIDFGSQNCADLYGTKRRGTLTATLSGPYDATGTVTTITCSNFYVNDYRVEGTMTITNLGIDSSGKQQFGVKVESGMVTLSGNENGKIISWACDYQYELAEINGTALIFDDVYHITGTASGVNEEGRSFTTEITEMQVKEMNCRWNGFGKVKVSPDDLKENEVDYKEGECDSVADCCDNVASVDIGKGSHTLRMH